MIYIHHTVLRPVVLRPIAKRFTSRIVKTRISPMSADLMNSFHSQSIGLSAMLFVFFIGRIVIDAAEESIRTEKKHDSYDSDRCDSDDENDY